jgi:hypothetical protein
MNVYPFVVTFGSEGKKTHHVFTQRGVCFRFNDASALTDEQRNVLAQITELNRSFINGNSRFSHAY